jgi:hypothetical protein
MRVLPSVCCWCVCLQDGALTKAVLRAMGGKAAAATTKDLALTVAALAKMGRYEHTAAAAAAATLYR